MDLQYIDTTILLFFNQGIANAWFDVLMPLLSYQGFLLVAPFLLLLFVRGCSQDKADRKRHLLTAVSAIVVACTAVYVSGLAEDQLKLLIGRVRPCRVIDGIRLITRCPETFSMPSGHAISSFAFATPLFYMTRGFVPPGWRIYPLALAALIALSRLYLGVHYPSDVLAGGLLGAAFGFTYSWIARMFTERGGRAERS